MLNHRADVEMVNAKGRTALSFAAAPSDKRKTPMTTLKVLLERGADFSTEDNEGNTPRKRAEKEKRFEAVKLLKQYERGEGGEGAL